MRVFSGMQPSGSFHLGNYQVLTNWIQLQQDPNNECFFCIVDWHALTSTYKNTRQLSEIILNMAIDWLSVGLDPEKNKIFVQSNIKEHAELYLLLSMITPVSWLKRVPSYKEKLNRLGKDINTYGFLGYPILQVADIVLYNTDLVPVADDQLPHLELARESLRRFNRIYGNVFKEVKAILTLTLPGIDGRKMSKSYNNGISLSASSEEIKGKVKLMVTDPQRIKKTDPGNPVICTVAKFHKIFSKELINTLEKECKTACIGCVECKNKLAFNINNILENFREKRYLLAKKPQYIKEMLAYGAQRAEIEAAKMMVKIRKAMNLDIFK